MFAGETENKSEEEEASNMRIEVFRGVKLILARTALYLRRCRC